MKTGEGSHGSNPQSYSLRPKVVDRRVISMFFCEEGVHVILRKVSPCTIEDNVFGEYHSLSTLKTSYFVYFENRSAGAFLSLQQTNISAPTQLSILDLVDLSLLYRFYIFLNLFSS